jgi:hypothetical protein
LESGAAVVDCAVAVAGSLQQSSLPTHPLLHPFTGTQKNIKSLRYSKETAYTMIPFWKGMLVLTIFLDFGNLLRGENFFLEK